MVHGQLADVPAHQRANLPTATVNWPDEPSHRMVDLLTGVS